MKRVVSYFLFLSFILFLSSCSGKDYVDAIPENSVAVASVDVRQLFGGNPDEALSGVLDAGGVASCGVDWSARLYVFETVEGNIGMAAKVSDDDKLAGWLAGLAEKGRCSKVTEQDGGRFAVVKGSWVVGFSSGAVVALGPLLPAVQGEISQRTEDLVGPYELHDFFLYYMLRWGFPPRKIFRLAEYALGRTYSRDVILKWLKVFYRRFFSQQFKRSCVPDGPKVGSAALSPRGDWRMPSDASAALWMAELETLK